MLSAYKLYFGLKFSPMIAIVKQPFEEKFQQKVTCPGKAQVINVLLVTNTVVYKL